MDYEGKIYAIHTSFTSIAVVILQSLQFLSVNLVHSYHPA